ncbi:hypothetical protein [Hydrogenophaga sp. NFH-34]|uniref:hypothetical protein n=1 Tax=Hydrogenophaga sp. NFH-34 TaxID=2744446 RepID=UPI001F3AB855|nr:hypothetical protein [Hydrogenophaga sp. NFH-34]
MSNIIIKGNLVNSVIVGGKVFVDGEAVTEKKGDAKSVVLSSKSKKVTIKSGKVTVTVGGCSDKGLKAACKHFCRG